jgi:hypothetical protein
VRAAASAFGWERIGRYHRATAEGWCVGHHAMVDGVVFVRVLADRAWQAHEAVYRVWEAIRPAVAGKAAQPIRKP